MTTRSPSDPVAVAVTAAIRAGRTDDLRQLIAEHPDLASASIRDDGTNRSLLHVATDWPGHLPDVAATIRVLVEAGADVDARFSGPHRETPLHWAASADDIEALDALLDAGADIDADGGVIAGSTALADATAFGQWAAARRLHERGARARTSDLAALGLTDEVLGALERSERSSGDDVDHAFWSACHGGHLATAEALLARGAEIDWLPGWEDATPLDIAARSGAHDLIRWLHSRGARTAIQVRGAARRP